MDSRCSAQHAIFPLTDNERGACDAALHLSQHTTIELLPNVHINEKMELSGFHFECAGCDMANVLPIASNMFDCIVAYEVIHDVHTSFNDKVLHILLNMEEYKQKLSTVVAELKTHTTRVPSFSCMVDDVDDETKNEDELVFTKSSCDREVWDEQMPRKVGLYHAFVRPYTKDSIDHKLFLVVSGSLPFIDEEFHRLWQDCNTFTTCEQLLESEELQYLRSATLRNHNRVAARVADALGLPVRCFIDTECPSGKKRSAHPTTITQKSDIELDLHTRRVHMVDNGCFLHKSHNGILFDMHCNEGYWLYRGPPDNASQSTFGTIFDYPGTNTCFPTSTFKYHDKFPSRGTVVSSVVESNKDTLYEREEQTQIDTLFPTENFMKVCEKLGFNRNHDIVHFMPVLKYISERAF